MWLNEFLGTRDLFASIIVIFIILGGIFICFLFIYEMLKCVIAKPCGTKYRIRSQMSFGSLSLQDVMGLVHAFGPMKNEREWYIQKRWFCFWFTISERWFQYTLPKIFKSREEAEQYVASLI